MGTAPSKHLSALELDNLRRQRARCPACNGTGRQPDQLTQSDDRFCEPCHSFGWVLPNANCACGRSPNMEQEGILFCGRPPCLERLKTAKLVDQYLY
jgi:hypothetical protein